MFIRLSILSFDHGRDHHTILTVILFSRRKVKVTVPSAETTA